MDGALVVGSFFGFRPSASVNGPLNPETPYPWRVALALELIP